MVLRRCHCDSHRGLQRLAALAVVSLLSRRIRCCESCIAVLGLVLASTLLYDHESHEWSDSDDDRVKGKSQAHLTRPLLLALGLGSDTSLTCFLRPPAHRSLTLFSVFV
jgi:hypothetical protein